MAPPPAVARRAPRRLLRTRRLWTALQLLRLRAPAALRRRACATATWRRRLTRRCAAPRRTCTWRPRKRRPQSPKRRHWSRRTAPPDAAASSTSRVRHSRRQHYSSDGSAWHAREARVLTRAVCFIATLYSHGRGGPDAASGAWRCAVPALRVGLGAARGGPSAECEGRCRAGASRGARASGSRHLPVGARGVRRRHRGGHGRRQLRVRQARGGVQEDLRGGGGDGGALARGAARAGGRRCRRGRFAQHGV